MDLDLRTLRIWSRYTQARAAALAGVSERTWRRWERDGCRLAERWMRWEAGYVPGWPRGWRVRRDGIEIPGLGLAQLNEIEARGYVWELVHDQHRAEARRIYDAVLTASGTGRCASSAAASFGDSSVSFAFFGP